MKVTQDEMWVRPCVKPECIEYKRQMLLLRAKVRDLKARLKAVRESARPVATHYGLKLYIDPAVGHALDLRRKNWRTP